MTRKDAPGLKARCKHGNAGGMASLHEVLTEETREDVNKQHNRLQTPPKTPFQSCDLGLLMSKSPLFLTSDTHTTLMSTSIGKKDTKGLTEAYTPLQTQRRLII